VTLDACDAPIGPAQDRFDLAVSAIAEFVLTADTRPGEQQLVVAGVLHA
jgi:hypothetical protein